MTKQLAPQNIVFGHGTHAGTQSRNMAYEPPRVRIINEEEVLSAFQVVLSAGSASWWMV
jgi:hypothetical protein